MEQFALEVGRGQALAGVGAQALAKVSTEFRGHAQSGSLAMASELGEQLGHRLQSLQQMERRDAAPGALRHAVLDAQHEHRTVKPLHHAAGHDAHHAAMPALAGEHQRGFVIGHRLRRRIARRWTRAISASVCWRS